MNTILEQYKDKINGTFSFFDRIIIKGHILQKQSGKTSRLLRKLREHGMIKKIPHSQRYLLTSNGRRITGALIETKRKIYPELAAIG